MAPTANAGSNQTTSSGVTVTLNGSLSTDPDGSIASYAWTQSGGTPSVTLNSATVVSPTFAAPQVNAATTLTFSLTVTDNQGATSPASTVTITVNPAAAGTTNVTGKITFARVPESNTQSAGLDYANQSQQPARGVLVKAVAAGTTTPALATATTDANGNYTLAVPNNQSINVIAVAEMLRDNTVSLPHWDFKARDVQANAPPYTYTDAVAFNSSAGTPHDLAIPSGFNSMGSVTGTRASAPFAVLDTVYRAVQFVLTVAPNTDFPALDLDWAADNPGSQTYFAPSNSSIVLSADPTEDTDEFDQHIIAHEFGHYVEHNFSRADNIGGLHGLGDRLDPRVAFGEGFGYAFSAMVLNDPVVRDSFVQMGTPVTSIINVETNPSTNPPGGGGDRSGCWCSESTVWSLLWDFYDNAADANDNVALGFAPMWTVLTGTQKTTPAFTTIFSFVTALKGTQSASVNTNINTLVAAQNITASSIDAFASTETHFPAEVVQGASLPLYTTATLGTPMILRNVNDAGTFNKLGNHRYVRLDVASARNVTVTASSSNPNTADTDFRIYKNGSFVTSGETPPPDPQSKTFAATAGTYLIDVYDCANGCDTSQGTEGDYDLTVTVN